MTARPALILMVFAQMLGAGVTQGQSSNIIGSWKVEITFGNGDSRSLRFEAEGSGKGSFALIGPRSNAWGGTGPSEAKWTQGDAGSVTVSGTVEFPIGNVGRDAGTLVLNGKFGTGSLIAGEAVFFPLGQDPNDPKARASKSGVFKAIRSGD